MAGLVTLNCPSCGAALHYEKGVQALTCDHCGNTHLLETDGQLPAVSPKLPKQKWIHVGEYDIFLHEVVDALVGDQRVIYINIEYANSRTKDSLSCRRNQWLLFDQDSYSYEASYSNNALYEDQHRPYFGSERFLNPGMRARGWLAFKVPAAAHIQRLHFFTAFLGTKAADFLIGGR